MTVNVVADEPDRITRAATDALRLVVASVVLVVLMVVGLLFDDAVVGFVADLYRGIDAVPKLSLIHI